MSAWLRVPASPCPPRPKARLQTRPTIRTSQLRGLPIARKDTASCRRPIPSLLERHATSRFTVHGVVAGSDAEEDGWILDHLGKLGPRVDIRRGVLSDAEYVDLLSRTDLLLLPYDPEAYRARGSALCNEARRMGIPIVAPAECAFAWRAFEEGHGVPMSRYSPRGLTEATVDALGRLDVLKAHASAVAAAATDPLPGILEATVEAARGRPRHGAADRLRRLLGAAF